MKSTLPLSDLVALSQSRWLLPVLALIAKREGARFSEMITPLGVSRESLTRTLEGLIHDGWIRRNPGHGHPLRPEYILTPAGHEVARHAVAIENGRQRLCLEASAMTRWSLPIIRSISDGACRFNELARTLPAATPRALSQSLKSLSVNNLVRRDVIDDHPPASIYRLTRNGTVLARVI